MNQNLYVVTAISNPARYESRYKLYHAFAKHVRDAGGILVTAEAAFGDREHLVVDGPMDVAVRTSHELWHKENLLNLAIQSLPSDWQYVAWVDADVTFARPDWVTETIEQLQHFAVVQMFSEALDLSPKHTIFQRHHSFASQFVASSYDPQALRHGYTFWHPGFAWAATRRAIDTVGGLIDWSPLGAADHHMAAGLIGRVEDSVREGVSQSFLDSLVRWQTNALLLNMSIGFVEGTIMHHWHGRKTDRKYMDRWDILVETQFDPLLDLKKDSQGLWQLTDRVPRLRHLLREYFRARNEDSIDFDPTEYCI